MTSELIERVARASEEVERLYRELDITNADHIALWLEGNTIQDEPMSQCVSWLACRIVEAHERAIAAIQTNAAPVAWMYERGSERKAYVERSQAALACGYAETPLYAHPPVADRVSTSSPVDDRDPDELVGFFPKPRWLTYEVDAKAAIAATQADADLERIKRERDQAVEALREAERAIAEYYRYWTGGETRGSYDGKPERNGLWKAKHKARQALASIEGTGHE